MAILDLLFSNKSLSRLEWPVTDGITIFRFDVLNNVNHQMLSEITQNEIEDGSNISDHVNIKNKKATFSIIVSDTPLRGLAGIAKGVGTSIIADKIRKLSSELIIIGGEIAANIAANVSENSELKSKAAFGILENLHNNKILITAILGFRRYENAIITNISVPQNVSNSRSLNANITIEEVRIVQTETALIPNDIIDESVENTATSKVNTGSQSTDNTSDKVQQGSSILFSIFGGEN